MNGYCFLWQMYFHTYSPGHAAPVWHGLSCITACDALSEVDLWHLQISKLMGHYTQSTGQQFSGGNSQYAKLAQIASQKCGINIPPALLMKL